MNLLRATIWAHATDRRWPGLPSLDLTDGALALARDTLAAAADAVDSEERQLWLERTDDNLRQAMGGGR